MSQNDSDDDYNISRVHQKPKHHIPHHSQGRHHHSSKNKDFARHIRYTYCCEKCKYPEKPNGRCCVCVVPRSQRRVKLGEDGCRTCGCRGCTKEDRYYFEQRRDGMKVVDTEGLNYRQNHRGKRKRSHVSGAGESNWSLLRRIKSEGQRRLRRTRIRGGIGRAVILRRASRRGIWSEGGSRPILFRLLRRIWTILVIRVKITSAL